VVRTAVTSISGPTDFALASVLFSLILDTSSVLVTLDTVGTVTFPSTRASLGVVVASSALHAMKRAHGVDAIRVLSTGGSFTTLVDVHTFLFIPRSFFKAYSLASATPSESSWTWSASVSRREILAFHVVVARLSQIALEEKVVVAD
jgi:hypothetical protein